MNATLFPDVADLDDPPPAPPSGYTLWYRGDAPRASWEAIHHAESEAGCVDAIGTGGRRGGRWIILRHGQEP